MDRNESVVVAVFEDRSTAEAAIEGLKGWDKASDDVKLGAIGLLFKEDGRVRSVIGHQTGRGLKVGAIVGVIAGVLSGGIGLAGGAAAGALLGGALGSFFSKSLNLARAECDALGMELELGKAAVVVTVDEYELSPIRLNLEHAGGVCKLYDVPQEAVNEAAAAIQARWAEEERLAERGLDLLVPRSGADLSGLV